MTSPLIATYQQLMKFTKRSIHILKSFNSKIQHPAALETRCYQSTKANSITSIYLVYPEQKMEFLLGVIPGDSHEAVHYDEAYYLNFFEFGYGFSDLVWVPWLNRMLANVTPDPGKKLDLPRIPEHLKSIFPTEVYTPQNNPAPSASINFWAKVFNKG